MQACDARFGSGTRLPTALDRARAVPHRACLLGQSSLLHPHILAEDVFSSRLCDYEMVEAV